MNKQDLELARLQYQELQEENKSREKLFKRLNDLKQLM